MKERLWTRVRIQVPGIHKYPEGNHILKNFHRHLFKIEVWVEQKHENRDIEYLELQERLRQILLQIYEKTATYNNTLNFGNDSCEMVAKKIQDYMHDTLNYRSHKIFVSEDGENGAVLEVDRHENGKD